MGISYRMCNRFLECSWIGSLRVFHTSTSAISFTFADRNDVFLDILMSLDVVEVFFLSHSNLKTSVIASINDHLLLCLTIENILVRQPIKDNPLKCIPSKNVILSPLSQVKSLLYTLFALGLTISSS